MSAESYLAENQNRFIAELMEFIAIPSVSADPKAGAEMARAADWVVARLTRAGVERARVVPTAGHPMVMGEWLMRRALRPPSSMAVIPPFLAGRIRRIHAAIFSFWTGVMPPMPMFGRSLLYVHSHCVAKSWASSMVSMMYWSSHSCRTVRL